MRPSAVRNILLLIWERDVSARDFLAGFAHYSNTRPNWCVSILHAADALMPSTVQSIVSGQYDGLILTDTFLAAHPELGESPTTAVAVIGEYGTCPRPPRGRFAGIAIDNAEIGRLGARHLMGLGRFNAYAFVPPPKSEDWDRQRADSFCRELAANRLRGETYDRTVPMADWLRALPKPTALMAACDYTAIEVMATCATLALRIPQDISILGVDNDELLCEFARPSLTSIRSEHFACGLRAARTLNGLLQTRARASCRPKTVLCSGAKVIERESTRPLSPALHLIHLATAYIKANVTEEIGVTDVVNHLGVSRRLADLRFRECHGRTIHETIIETKLAELATRLLTSNLSIGKVAATLGFRDLSYVGLVFRRRYGMTMSEWRSGRGTLKQRGEATPSLPRPVTPP